MEAYAGIHDEEEDEACVSKQDAVALTSAEILSRSAPELREATLSRLLYIMHWAIFILNVFRGVRWRRAAGLELKQCEGQCVIVENGFEKRNSKRGVEGVQEEGLYYRKDV